MKARALVVDDSLTVRMDLLEALETADFEAKGCGTVADARAALAEEPFDIAIVGLRLGDGDGVELLEEIRKREGHAGRMPVMMLSSEAEVRDRIRGLERGADEYAAKPYTVSWVIARARELTQREAAQKPDDRAELLLELERKNAELEVAHAELEAFSYTVSHDLRAPLRAVEGFARALEEDEGDHLGEDGKKHLARIYGATKRMNELIEDLLALARVTRAEIVPRTVDLGEVARGVVADLRSRAPDRVVEVVIADGMTVEGDPGLLRAVLENLLGNAWKFTSKKEGPVRIEVGVADRDDQGHEERAFFVADNGAGFDLGLAEKLFRPFKRLHSPKDFEGTGIGLATVRNIIVRHGGRVWAESAPGEGARFWFTLG